MSEKLISSQLIILIALANLTIMGLFICICCLEKFKTIEESNFASNLRRVVVSFFQDSILKV